MCFNIGMYLTSCATCDEKRKRPRKGVVVKPIVSNDFNGRAQVDLISFKSEKDGYFKFILTYQDHLTMLVNLRALKAKRTEEVAYKILDICVRSERCTSCNPTTTDD